MVQLSVCSVGIQVYIRVGAEDAGEVGAMRGGSEMIRKGLTHVQCMHTMTSPPLYATTSQSGIALFQWCWQLVVVGGEDGGSGYPR